MFPLIAAGIGALGNIFGAVTASNSAKKGAQMTHRDTRWAAKQNLKYQKQFAQHGIQWRTRDALKAGIHPLAALGAQTPGFSPSFTAGNAGEIMAQGGAAAGEMYSRAGQDISRGVSAMGDVDSKMAALQLKSAQLQLQNMELQNAALASDIALKTQAGTSPIYPSENSRYIIPGQASTVSGPLIADEAMRRQGWNPSKPSHEPGDINDVGFIRTPEGGQFPVPSADAKQRIDDDFLGTLLWNLRNRLMGPATNAQAYDPSPNVPQGYYRSYDPVNGWRTLKRERNKNDPYDGAYKY